MKCLCLLGMFPYSIAQQYKLAQFKQCCGCWEVGLFCSWGVSSDIYIRQKENGRISIPWRLCVFTQLVDDVVQYCSNSVMHLCLWIVMHSLDIHAWLAVTGKIDTFSKFTILCQNLEDKLFFNNMCFWEHFRSYHDSRNDLAFIVSHKRGEKWQTCLADILHQIFCFSRGRPRRNGEFNFGRVLLSCRFESNTDARKDLACLCKLWDRREFLYLPYSNCLKAQT